MAAVPQKHKIMRQVLELRGCPEGEARRAQAELRETYYRRLVPLIDRICSELGAPHRIDRIDTLEIDLGAVPLEALESAVAGKFEAAFAEKLGAAIGDAPPLDAELQLFELFIRTGTVPWWADLAERALLASALEGLIGRAPRALRRAMAAAPEPQRMLRRVALAYPDRLLAELCAVLAPSLTPALAPLLVELGTVWARLKPTARNFWWEELLKHALQIGAAPQAGGSAAAAQAFFRAVLVRIARRLRVDYRVLIEDLRRALDAASSPAQSSPGQSSTHDIVQALSRETDGGVEAMKAAQGAAAPHLERTLARLEALLVPHAGLLARLREIRRLPLAVQAQATASLEAALIEAGIVTPEALMRPNEKQVPAEKETRPVCAFSDADAIYVDNAGLVILWPFLQAFFGNLGLLEEKAFKDEAARSRAVGLLQFLATGQAPDAEYLLPLNKALCGMELEEVFDFGEPMTEAEVEACDDLLHAVIEQAPILNHMSIAGFRASFLLRKGQLGARDGNWLLRVERETHDVVLDRFPWSFQYVKLPWMEAVMGIEW